MPFILTILAIALFYWLFITSDRGSFTSTRKDLTFETVLHSEFGYIIALIAKLAKSDGHISELEIELIENVLDDLCQEFDDPTQALAHLKLIFDEEKSIQDNIAFVASQLYNKTINEAFKHQKVVEFLVNLAFIDGELHAREKEVIFEIAHALHIDSGAVEMMFSQFDNFYEERSSSKHAVNESNYYDILDIDSDYDEKTLKTAYKRGVKRHHPDVIMGQGGTAVDIRKATEKLQDINEAYEYLKKKKGF